MFFFFLLLILQLACATFSDTFHYPAKMVCLNKRPVWSTQRSESDSSHELRSKDVKINGKNISYAVVSCTIFLVFTTCWRHI